MRTLLRRILRAESGKSPASAAPPPSPASDAVLERVDPLLAQGDFAGALRLARQALEADPENAELHFAVGVVLLEWGRVREAVSALTGAERRGCARIALHLNLAQGTFLLGDVDGAERQAKLALQIDDGSADAHFTFATILKATGRSDDAVAHYERAFALSGRRDALTYAAACRIDQRDGPRAEAAARVALQHAPDDIIAWTTLAMALTLQDRGDEADAAFERGLALGGTERSGAAVFADQAMSLLHFGRIDDALALLRRELPRHPEPAAHSNYAFAALTAGDFGTGWRHYEFRWLQEPLRSTRPSPPLPVWQGQDLDGRTLLLRTEQGAGDLIQFARFGATFRAMGARVVLQVPDALFDLAKCFAGVDAVVPWSQPVAGFDFWLSLMSVPHALGLSAADVAAAIPYVEVPHARRERWRERIGHGGMKVGMVWAGNPGHHKDRWRSLPLGVLAPVFDVPGIAFHSLQKEVRPQDRAAIPTGAEWIDLAPHLADFCDTAAAIEQLDLVIAVDTAVAHLAGALGKPVWLLLHAHAEFRWMQARSDTPWYPSMRLFRQQRLGDWSTVVREITEELARLGAGRALRPQYLDAPLVRAAQANAELDDGLAAVCETRYGPIEYLPGDSLIGRSLCWYGEWLEQPIELLVQCLAASPVIVEAAAGIGAHALALGTRVGPGAHLLLYENDPVHRCVLRTNVGLCGLNDRVTIRRSALRPASPGSGQSGEHASHTRDTEAIDDLQLDRLDLLKVHGSANARIALEGASDTLWRLRPLVFVTLTADEDAAGIAEIVERHGYRTWIRRLPVFDPRNFNRRDRDVLGGAVVVALVAAPEEGRNEAIEQGLCAPSNVGATSDPAQRAAVADMSPGAADACADAVSLLAQGDRARALQRIDRALEQHGDQPTLRHVRGIVLEKWGRAFEAHRELVRAQAGGEAGCDLLLHLAAASAAIGRRDEAHQAIARARQLQPASVEAHVALGRMLQAEGRYGEAIASFEAALARAPDRVDCLPLLIACHLDANDGPRAEARAREALARGMPAPARIWAMLGTALVLQHRRDEALEASRRAEQLGGGEVFANVAFNFAELGLAREAVEVYRRWLPAVPDLMAHRNYAAACLSVGGFEQGWKQYEYRFAHEPLRSLRPRLAVPRWRGQDLTGKTVLVWAEQGAGDLIQFARFAPVLQRRGARVILLVSPPHRNLAADFAGVEVVVSRLSEVDERYDYHVPLLSLSAMLQQELGPSPAQASYLRVDAAAARAWRARMTPDRLNVGLVWAGDPTHHRDRFRSIELARMAPMLSVPGVQFHALQKDLRTGDVALLERASNVLDQAAALRDYRDTAAALSALDLVIAVDTSVAHLAGALGRPVWTLLPATGDFRWLEGRDDTPWYPSMRLFRQQRLGEWDEVIHRVATALERAVADPRSLEVRGLPGHWPEPPAPIDGIAELVEGRWGLFQLQPNRDDESVGLAQCGEHLPGVLEMLTAIAPLDAHVVEVAAGVGGHAVPLARLLQGGHVWLYEADERQRQMLEHNLAINGVRHVATLLTRSLEQVSGSPGRSTEPLDALALAQLDVLKLGDPACVDAVLAGAERTLARLRPAVLVHLDAPAGAGPTVARLAKLGYRCWRASTPYRPNASFGGGGQDPFEGRRAHILLGLPEERDWPVPTGAVALR